MTRSDSTPTCESSHIRTFSPATRCTCELLPHSFELLPESPAVPPTLVYAYPHIHIRHIPYPPLTTSPILLYAYPHITHDISLTLPTTTPITLSTITPATLLTTTPTDLSTVTLPTLPTPTIITPHTTTTITPHTITQTTYPTHPHTYTHTSGSAGAGEDGSVRSWV